MAYAQWDLRNYKELKCLDGTHLSRWPHRVFWVIVMDLNLEEQIARLIKRLNILLILLMVELIPITLLATYFLLMFIWHPIGASD